MKGQLLAIAFATMLFSGISYADSIYQVSGNFAIPGKSTCPISPCAEVVGFSFQMKYVLEPVVSSPSVPYPAYVPVILPGTIITMSTGPIAGLMNFGGFGFDFGSNYIPFSISNLPGLQTEIDLLEVGGYVDGPGSRPPSPDLPGPPVFTGVYLYCCGSQYFENGQNGAVSANVTVVPEGSELAMLGIAALMVLGAIKRKSRVPRP